MVHAWRPRQGAAAAAGSVTKPSSRARCSCGKRASHGSASLNHWGWGGGMACRRRIRDWHVAGACSKLRRAMLVRPCEHDQIDWVLAVRWDDMFVPVLSTVAESFWRFPRLSTRCVGREGAHSAQAREAPHSQLGGTCPMAPALAAPVAPVAFQPGVRTPRSLSGWRKADPTTVR